MADSKTQDTIEISPRDSYTEAYAFYTGVKVAIDTIKKSDTCPIFRAMDFNIFLKLYKEIKEYKNEILAFLNQSSIIVNEIPSLPCENEPISKFDLIAQNFDKMHIIPATLKAENFAKIINEIDEIMPYVDKFTERRFSLLHKVTNFENVFSSDLPEFKKRQILIYSLVFLYRNKTKTFKPVSVLDSMWSQLDRLVFIPQEAIRKLRKDDMRLRTRVVTESQAYQSYEIIREYWRKCGVFSRCKHKEWGYVTRYRNVQVARAFAEIPYTYKYEESYMTTFDTPEGDSSAAKYTDWRTFKNELEFKARRDVLQGTLARERIAKDIYYYIEATTIETKFNLGHYPESLLSVDYKIDYVSLNEAKLTRLMIVEINGQRREIEESYNIKIKANLEKETQDSEYQFTRLKTLSKVKEFVNNKTNERLAALPLDLDTESKNDFKEIEVEKEILNSDLSAIVQFNQVKNNNSSIVFKGGYTILIPTPTNNLIPPPTAYN